MTATLEGHILLSERPVDLSGGNALLSVGTWQDQTQGLAEMAQEYAMALDEALEGLQGGLHVLQDLQALTLLAPVAPALAAPLQQRAEQAVEACGTLLAGVEQQLVPFRDELHVLLRQRAEQARGGDV